MGLFVAGALAVVALAAAVTVARGSATWPEALAAAKSSPLLASLAQLAGAALAIGVGVMVAHGEVRYRDALGVRPVNSAVLMLVLTAGLAAAFPLRELALLLADGIPAIAPDPSRARALTRMLRVDGWGDALAVPLVFVAIPAVSEELFFRGLLLPGLAKRMDPRLALLASSALFGLIHGAPIAIVYATLAGLALGWIRLKTGSVLASVALHGAVNAVPVLLPAELIRIRGFNTIEEDVYHLPLTLVLGSFLVTLACLALAARLSDEG